MSGTERFSWIGLFVGVLLALAPGASAQLSEQSVSLNPGWNSVFLELEPVPARCEEIFLGSPVESVWKWNERSGPVQYIDREDVLIPDESAWLVYQNRGELVSSLHRLEGGRTYLIRLSGGSPYTLVIQGRPTGKGFTWIPDSFNLTGFFVDPAAAPTFSDYLSHSQSLRDSPVYRLSSAGTWIAANVSTEHITSGEAYWIYCQGASDYTGPIRFRADNLRGLEFSRTLDELAVHLQVVIDSSLELSVSPVSYESGSGDQAVAGDLPISYWRVDTGAGKIGWEPIEDTFNIPLSPGNNAGFRVAARRAAITLNDADGTEKRFAALLELKDGLGTRRLLPVSGLASPLAATGGKEAGKTTLGDRAGLWVGSVSVDQVSEPLNVGAPTEPVEAGSEFWFRIIVHVDDSGTARLLREVVQLSRPGTYTENPDDPSTSVVDESYRYALVTRDDLLDEFDGAAIRDDAAVGRRISSAAFGFSEPVAMEGAFGESLSCTIVRGYDEATNPFVHKFHPDHNNLDEDPDTPEVLPDRRESYTFERALTLTFTDEDPDQMPWAGFGDTQLGGLYEEGITGIYQDDAVPLRVRGTFRLHRISRIGVLNDGIE